MNRAFQAIETFQGKNRRLKSVYRSFCRLRPCWNFDIYYLCGYFKTLEIASYEQKKCPVCHSSNTKRNGQRKGRQLYKCMSCGYQFRSHNEISSDELWRLYTENKQTIGELAQAYSVSESTIKRRLSEITKEWEQPALCGSGFVHLDATYWGRNWGVLLALDEESGMPLFVSFINHERVQDYIDAVTSIQQRGFIIKGLILDGMQSLFREFKDHKLQMCHFHMRQIVRRYVTKSPKLLAARELNELMKDLTKLSKQEFTDRYQQWKTQWEATLNRRSQLKSGKTQYTHRRLRSAMHSIDFYMPYLFTYQTDGCEGMPNTNNKIEGTFTDLKKNLNNHSGMNEQNRKRFICGFFLALKNALSMKKLEP